MVTTALWTAYLDIILFYNHVRFILNLTYWIEIFWVSSRSSQVACVVLTKQALVRKIDAFVKMKRLRMICNIVKPFEQFIVIVPRVIAYVYGLFVYVEFNWRSVRYF